MQQSERRDLFHLFFLWSAKERIYLYFPASVWFHDWWDINSHLNELVLLIANTSTLWLVMKWRCRCCSLGLRGTSLWLISSVCDVSVEVIVVPRWRDATQRFVYSGSNCLKFLKADNLLLCLITSGGNMNVSNIWWCLTLQHKKKFFSFLSCPVQQACNAL